MTSIPMTVISGYLGAGKTTLINRLLAQSNGRRLMVLVNDFGNINIDAALLKSADEDTIALTNGCVCCTLGADLFMAIGDVLDRRPRPDHLIIEASGIADPIRIANVAHAEPELHPAGIVTVIDGHTFCELRDDALIGPQFIQQIAQADLLWISKANASAIRYELEQISAAPILAEAAIGNLPELLFAIPTGNYDRGEMVTHPDYIFWSHQGPEMLTREAILKGLKDRPKGLFRVKGVIRSPLEQAWEVHAVGKTITVTSIADLNETRLVGIGLSQNVTRKDAQDWWAQLSVSYDL